MQLIIWPATTMQTNSVCPSSSSNTNITAHGGTGGASGSEADACTGNAGKNSTKTNTMAVGDQQEEMVNWSSHACPYCTKSFDSSQALGGHQNAHRQERDADRREYLASRRARMSTRTIMAAAHHSTRSAFPMLPHGASLYGSSSSAGGYGHGYGYGSAVGFVHHPNKNSVYVGVPVHGPCPNCRRWFGYQPLQKQAIPIEYNFIPTYESNSLGGIRGSSSSSSSSSSASAPTVIVLDEDEEYEVEINMTKQRRLDLTLRL